MGGSRFFTRSSGKNMQEAYKKAYDRAEEEYGHQEGYSGQINSTHGFTDLTSDYKKSKATSVTGFEDLLDQRDAIHKGNAYGVCEKEPVGNNNKIKTTVTDKVLKGTRVWKMWYVVYSSQSELGKALLKADAVKIARDYTDKTGNRSFVVVSSRSIQDATVAQIDYKPSSNESLGEYIFFGIAPE